MSTKQGLLFSKSIIGIQIIQTIYNVLTVPQSLSCYECCQWRKYRKILNVNRLQPNAWPWLQLYYKQSILRINYNMWFCDFYWQILYTNINRQTYKIEIDTNYIKIVKIRHKLFNDHKGIKYPDNIKGNYSGSEDFSYHFRIPCRAVLMDQAYQS